MCISWEFSPQWKTGVFMSEEQPTTSAYICFIVVVSHINHAKRCSCPIRYHLVCKMSDNKIKQDILMPASARWSICGFMRRSHLFMEYSEALLWPGSGAREGRACRREKWCLMPRLFFWAWSDGTCYRNCGVKYNVRLGKCIPIVAPLMFSILISWWFVVVMTSFLFAASTNLELFMDWLTDPQIWRW